MSQHPSTFRIIFMAGVAVTVALGVGVIGVTAKETPTGAPAAERGYRVAARECSGCHSIEPQGESPRPGAPPFREVRHRYNAISLAREFQAISAVGHYEMPARPISKSDGDDLIAFIESLG
ncbi:MAG TPA: cytochrome c [Caulobacteraceae bacterium]|nr:cytochrome c [Caulobacteraceae bacterium]